MKKVILFLLLCLVLSSGAFAKTVRKRTSSGKEFRFTEDMVTRIQKQCPSVMSKAPKLPENLESFCSVKDVQFGESDLGPWANFVSRAEKLFLQFRRLIYIGAVFMILWIFVKASYEGDMKWMQVAMLIIGVVLISGAEVLIAFATNRVSLEDVVSNGVYVDCRDKNTKNAYFKCGVDDSAATLYDSRYFLQVSGKVNSKSTKIYKGLY